MGQLHLKPTDLPVRESYPVPCPVSHSFFSTLPERPVPQGPFLFLSSLLPRDLFSTHTCVPQLCVSCLAQRNKCPQVSAIAAHFPGLSCVRFGGAGCFALTHCWSVACWPARWTVPTVEEGFTNQVSILQTRTITRATPWRTGPIGRHLRRTHFNTGTISRTTPTATQATHSWTYPPGLEGTARATHYRCRPQ